MVQHNRYTGYRSKRSGRRTLPRLSENIGEKQWQITRSDMWAAMWKYGTAANFSSAQIPRAKRGKSFRHKKRPGFHRGVRTVNGAHRCGCALFLYAIMTYGTAALALPLGELSPKVTERALQAFLNGDIHLCAHAAKIPINISVGKTQSLQSKRCQKCGTLRIIGHSLRLIVLRTIQFHH